MVRISINLPRDPHTLSEGTTGLYWTLQAYTSKGLQSPSKRVCGGSMGFNLLRIQLPKPATTCDDKFTKVRSGPYRMFPLKNSCFFERFCSPLAIFDPFPTEESQRYSARRIERKIESCVCIRSAREPNLNCCADSSDSSNAGADLRFCARASRCQEVSSSTGAAGIFCRID